MVCTKVLSSIGKDCDGTGGGGQSLEYAHQQVSVGGHV